MAHWQPSLNLTGVIQPGSPRGRRPPSDGQSPPSRRGGRVRTVYLRTIALPGDVGIVLRCDRRPLQGRHAH